MNVLLIKVEKKSFNPRFGHCAKLVNLIDNRI